MRGQDADQICMLLSPHLPALRVPSPQSAKRAVLLRKGYLLRAWGCWAKEKESSQEYEVIKRGSSTS